MSILLTLILAIDSLYHQFKHIKTHNEKIFKKDI